MADIPVPTNVTLTEDGDSVFEDVYIYGNLYYDFGSDDITFNTLNVTGKSTLGDLTVNNFNVSVNAKVTGITTVSNIEITGTLKDGDGDTGSTGQVLSFDGTDLKWINTSSANVGSASKVGINLDSDSTDTMYLTFVDNTTGNEEIRVDKSLTYKPSIGSFLGITSFTGVHLLDDNKIKFGNSNDLEVYYTNGTGSDGGSVFKHTGPHDMRFQVPSGAHDIVFEDTSGNNIAVYNADGGSEFYWRGGSGAGKKFDITQTGVTITGGATADSFVKSSGTSSQFLKADGSVDSSTYLTSFSETDTLDTVCDRGSSTDQNITTSGTLNDAAGNVREIVNNSKTSSYTLTANDVGELINTNSNVTIPSGVFSAGQGVTIYNNSSSNITISRSGVTAYTVGTATNTDKTLAQKGLATVMCVSANTFVVLGGGLS